MSDHFEYLPIGSIRIVTNVRQRFDEDKLRELAASIAEYGIIEPLIVRQDTELPEGTYALVAGERRLRAAKLAGLETVPVIVKALTAAQAARVQLLENLQRQDLDPIEEAQGLKRLLSEHGYTQDKLAEELGVSQSHIANRIRLLRLPEKAQDAISRGILFAGHGLALLKLAPEGVSPSPLLKEAVKDMMDNPPPVASAGDRVDGIIRSHGKSLRKAEHEYHISYHAVFDYKKECEAIKCPYLIKSKDTWVGHSCINPSCWKKKQAAARPAFEKALRDRQAEERARQKAEQKKYAQAAAQQEQDTLSEARRERLKDSLGQIPEVKREEVIAAEPDQMPLILRFTAEDLQQLGRGVWKTFKGSDWDRPAIISHECFLPLPILLQFFVARQEIGASQMPLQFGEGELQVPENQLWIKGYDGTGALAGISFEGDTLRFGRGPGYGIMGGGYLLEPRPEHPVYYRIEVAGEDAYKIMRQQVVIQGLGRRLVLTGAGRLMIRKDLLPKLQQLIEALPAMPGPVEMKGSPAEVTAEAEADTDDADLAEAVAADEEFEEDGPLYRRYYCMQCAKAVSDLEVVMPAKGPMTHAPTHGECDGEVVVLLPGQAEPTQAAS